MYLLCQLMANVHSTSLAFCLGTDKSVLELQLFSADPQDSLAACSWRSNLILISRLQFQSHILRILLQLDFSMNP